MSDHKIIRDPVTGYTTTGHEWNGIIELNTPFPRIAAWALAIAVAISVVMWILLPTWPTGREYTPGLLGLTQGGEAMDSLDGIRAAREEWMSRLDVEDPTGLAVDEDLMAKAMPAAAQLFGENCQACHGPKGIGGPGFPNLLDEDWLWGGDPATVVETITVGVNSTHPDSRLGQMMAFGRDGILSLGEVVAVADYVHALPASTADPESDGAQIFADNCASCHGEAGAGGLDLGAPRLDDNQWLYGGDRDAILETIRNGREGVMPGWAGRLSRAEINMLALYVVGLGREDWR